MSRISIALRFSRTVFASCAALSSFRIAFSTEDALVFLLADARLASTTAAPVLHPSQMRLRGMSMIITRPYLMFLGDVPDELAAKTAHGIVDWRRDWCLGQLRLPGCRADLGLADMTIAEAAASGAKTLVIGVANAGGVLPEHWTTSIVEAIEAGLDVASGLHARLASVTTIKKA